MNRQSQSRETVSHSACELSILLVHGSTPVKGLAIQGKGLPSIVVKGDSRVPDTYEELTVSSHDGIGRALCAWGLANNF